MATNVISDMLRQKESLTNGAEGSVAMLKESIQLVCVSQDSYPRNSILREPGILGSKHAVEFSKGTWHHINFRERKVHRRALSKSVNLMSAVLARHNSETDHMSETLHQERCARREA